MRSCSWPGFFKLFFSGLPLGFLALSVGQSSSGFRQHLQLIYRFEEIDRYTEVTSTVCICCMLNKAVIMSKRWKATWKKHAWAQRSKDIFSIIYSFVCLAVFTSIDTYWKCFRITALKTQKDKPSSMSTGSGLAGLVSGFGSISPGFNFLGSSPTSSSLSLWAALSLKRRKTMMQRDK